MAKAEYSEKLSLSVNCVLNLDDMILEFEENEPLTIAEALSAYDGKKVTITVVSEDAR